MRLTLLPSFPRQHTHFHADEEPRCSLHEQRGDCHISSIPKLNHRKTHCSLLELLHLYTTHYTSTVRKQIPRDRKIENHHRHEKYVDWNTYSRIMIYCRNRLKYMNKNSSTALWNDMPMFTGRTEATAACSQI